MEKDNAELQRFIEAKKKVTKLKVFYIHLCAYIVVLCLVIYNYVIIEENEYMQAIIWLNSSIMIMWGIVILIQGWTTFRGQILFGKRWEDKKVREFLDEEKTQMWE